MKNKSFLLIIIFSLVCCISCEKDKTFEAGKYMVEGQQLFNIIPDAVSDVDGNSYDAVKIGEQVWMKQNLRTTKYADGTPISQGGGCSSNACWYYPDSNAYNKPTYGLLYNWKAVMRNSSSSSMNPSGVQGICPNGWHVPSDAEWMQLFDYVSSKSQYHCNSCSWCIAKALAGTMWWSRSDNSCAVGNMSYSNNATGFSALPAGIYNSSYTNFDDSAYFWSATEYSNSDARCRFLYCESTFVSGSMEKKDYGFSVRCVKGEGSASTLTITTTAASNITETTATCGGNVISDGGEMVTARGVCWSTSHNPTLNNTHTIDGSGTGSFYSTIIGLSPGTTYYLRAYATNSVGTGYGNEVSFTTQQLPCGTVVTDVDGNTYNTIQIGSQCWMKENLRTTKYADGTPISSGSDTSTTVAYWYYPNNDATNKPTYGLLYNWKAMMRNSFSSYTNPSGVQGICPMGWHVPSDAEWKQMEMAVGMSQSDADSTGLRGNIAAKLSGNTGWTISTTANAAGNLSAPDRNSSGFSALPAGYYYVSPFSFGEWAGFWSATETYSSYAWVRYLRYNSAGVQRYSHNHKTQGHSVRCVKD